MALPLLSEPRRWTGHWWLPENPDHKVPGVLTYAPGDGLTLRMIGGWEYRNISTPAPDVTVVHEGLRSWPVVHGTAQNKRITLLDLQCVDAKVFSLRFDSGQPDQLDVIARTALIGLHLDSEDDAEFVSCSATIENLTAWSRESAIEHRVKLDQETDRLESGEIRYVPVGDPQKAKVGDVRANLNHLLTLPDFERTLGATTARIVERTSVEFSSTEPRPLREWLKMLSGMSDLMSLSTLTACTEITLHLWTPATPEAYPDDYPLRDRLHEVAVYERRVVTPDPDRKGADLRKFLLTLDDLPFPVLMPRWMEVNDKFSSAQSMILGLSYIAGGYLQSRVVTAIGAAESFHRALDVKPTMSEREFKELRKTLLEAVPRERKQWLADRIMRNEASLHERLVDLARRPGEFMVALVPDAEKWAKEATRARNGLAHDGRSESHTLEELYAVVEVTRAVVILNLLSQLGIPAKRMAKGLSEHPVLSTAARLGKAHFADENSAA
ncbi:hypothetical protein E3O11_03465 [Cryobacterium levicorallinum]|uniref:Uncharacterized protein n=1 Tax=Cryobacterium levicorallinum TaxID=995038 RepID=A0A4R8VUE3_9MICO|nr:HEPN domain-containing protein [Cryobacterium levicorallinum]TFB87874.1 hypothetical protein E3O11_03465 [Cryobacterium levicorallinum]